MPKKKKGKKGKGALQESSHDVSEHIDAPIVSEKLSVEKELCMDPPKLTFKGIVNTSTETKVSSQSMSNVDVTKPVLSGDVKAPTLDVDLKPSIDVEVPSKVSGGIEGPGLNNNIPESEIELP